MYEFAEDNIRKFFESKTIVITGACGTIGKKLTKALLEYQPNVLRLLDVDDTALTEFKDEMDGDPNAEALRFLLGNIREKNRLIRAFEGADFVFHCAALNDVAIGEYNPRELIRTNITGTENVIEAALHNNVKRVIYTSSDKAVNPTSTMGASKLLGEKLIVAANYVRGIKRTRFSCVRFGNVQDSRGSIIPRFTKRVEKGLDLILTDPDVTRFMMPLQDIINLTIKAITLSIGGEIFVFKMPSIVLRDLVDLFSEYAWMKFGISPKIETVGLFPGEKSFEELITEEELSRTIELADMYVVLPHIEELLLSYNNEIIKNIGKIQTKSYNSRFTTPLSKNELALLLKKNDVFSNS